MLVFRLGIVLELGLGLGFVLRVCSQVTVIDESCILKFVILYFLKTIDNFINILFNIII